MNSEEEELRQLPILAVDDDETNLLMLRAVLEGAGYSRVTTTPDPTLALGMCAQSRPCLVLLDLHMPKLDGFQLMERLAPLTHGGSSVPIIVLTADETEQVKRRALTLGARDFLTKPVDQMELLLRVRNLLQVQQLQQRLSTQNANLEHLVEQRTSDLERARLEILDRLALASEYRDDETQEHAWRIGRTSALLALQLGLGEREVELIRRAAPLHDIGKIGIPDAILLKPGRLSAEEFETIKSHTTIGAQILSGSNSPVLTMAESIALTHHERWHGGGYPQGLSGEAIPLPARLVAVADVFDALSHARPYKDAWPLHEAIAEIRNQSGRQFDPSVVAAFSSLDHPLLLSSVKGSGPRASAAVARAGAPQPIHA
jgi:putative two-component system response regulator